MRFYKTVLALLLLCAASACTTLAGKEEIGAVIARRAQVRSSTAIVAADLKEVVRGDELDILDSVTVPSAGDAEGGERWLHVRTGNDNILMKLESGARFDIVGWKRVPKPKSSESTESDDEAKAGAVEKGAG